MLKRAVLIPRTSDNLMPSKIDSFGDDLPKQNPWEEDRLGYAVFAERIAKIIIRLNAQNGYVIGLHGRWGSGKSTIINFIFRYIEKYIAEESALSIVCISYRPWIVSGHQDLIAAFFKVLSEETGPRDRAFFRGLKKVFGLFSGTTDKVVDAAATIAQTVDPSGGVASGFAGGLIKKVLNWAVGRANAEPSLQRSYDELRKQLIKCEKRFVVSIDDIDRLDPDEIKSLMGMVKSIGQLPNVIYILAYDRQIVWEALREDASHVGPRFAEKIVQHELDIPKPKRNALFKMLDEDISFIIGLIEDSARWQYIVRDGVQRWIQAPRDVVRLSNALKFSWAALEGEIDPQDLLAIEGLRLFDAGPYSWIRENRDFLFSEGQFALTQDALKEAAVEQLQTRIHQGIRPQVMRVLSVLFPQATKLFEKGQYSMAEPFDEVIKRRGLGCEAGYDTYFGMSPSMDAVPRGVLKDVFGRLDDEIALEAVIRSYLDKEDSQRQPMINEFLDELRVRYRSNSPPLPTQSLLNALVRTGEEIISIEWEGGLFGLSPRSRLSFLVRLLLERWGAECAGQRLIEAFECASSPVFIADIYVDRGRELGIFSSLSSESPVIKMDDFDKIGKTLVVKIRDAAETHTLEGAPFFFDILKAWTRNASPSEAKSWLEAGIWKSPEFMAKVGRGLVSYSVGTKERRYTMNGDPERDLYDLRVLVEAGKMHLKRDDLPRDQRNLISALVRGSESLLKDD